MSKFDRMEQVIGEDSTRSAGRSKNLITKEAIIVNDKHMYRVNQLKGDDGELPLFFLSNGSHVSSKPDDVLNLDHKPAAPASPLDNQEGGSWSSSFRFELDTQGDERLQTRLERYEQIPAGEAKLGRKLTDRKSLTESGTIDGGSFRFTGNEELQNGNQYGHSKSPRQLGSSGFTTVFNANESQGYDIAAGIKVAMNDRVRASPRSEVLQKLRDLKAHPLSPRFSPEDEASYQKEKAKIIVVKDDIQQRLKPLLKNEHRGKRSSDSISQYRCTPQASVLSELEIVEIKERRRQNLSSPSELRDSPWRTPEPPSPMQSTILTLRFRDDGNKLCEDRSQQEMSTIKIPSPDYVNSKGVAIPFTWEDKPGKPKTIARAVDRVLARRSSKGGIEYVELQSRSQEADVSSFIVNGHSGKGTGPEASGLSLSSSSNVDLRSGSHRYYGRHYMGGLSREGSLRRSTRRYSTSEKEALIDLDGSAAAKFLVDALESPSRSQVSSPTFLVPFKWEDAPGKVKVETIAKRPNDVLQLPPRLAVSSLRKSESFSSHGQRGSSPLGGLILPCLAASMPVHRKQFTSTYRLPPRPPVRRARLGLVSICSSTPKEGCQVWVLKSKPSSRIRSEKSLAEPQLTPVRTCSSISVPDLKIKSNAPSLPTNILCSTDKDNSQTSGSSIMFSSGDLEDFTTQTQKSASKSSSNTSFEYAEDDLAGFPEAATTKLAANTGFLNKEGDSTSSSYLNSKGESLTLGAFPTLQSKATNLSLEASPKHPSRLARTMPTIAEQLLASCSTSGRRQLLQDLSPRLLHQHSGRRHSCVNIPYRHLTCASHKKVVSPFPPYTTSIELFSSPANQQASKVLVYKPPLARPRRRIQLMSSIFKTLKRALGRKKRSLKRSEPMLTFPDGGKSSAADF